MKRRTLSHFSTLLRGNMNSIPVHIPVWNKNGKKIPVIVMLATILEIRNKLTRFYLILTIFFSLTVLTALGQTCTNTRLSNTFDFKTSINRIQFGIKTDSCIITVFVKSKLTKLTVQTISFGTEYPLFKSSFVDCNNVRSYTTGINKNAEVVDNDFGDLIVADFNFDKKEDFAVKREESGNGGPLYNYYIQTSPNKFKLDKFLSETMIFFPKEINKSKRTLTTLVHSSAVSVCETIYKFDSATNKWKEIGRRIIQD
jgi:hypothetical protein